MKIFSVGHATFRIELNGQVFLTDPWFQNSGILHTMFSRRIFPLPITTDSIDRCDLMLVSHNHIDHFDRAALQVARRLNTLVVGPAGIVSKARRHNVQNVCELHPGETKDAGDVRITATPAVHPLARDPIGFVLEGEKNLYFSGDTLFDWSIAEFLSKFRLDVAILQVSCSFYTWLSGADGMDITWAVELAKAIRPSLVVPMHFGCVGKYLDVLRKIRVNEHNLDVEDSLKEFQRLLKKEDISCEVLFPGGTLEL